MHLAVSLFLWKHRTMKMVGWQVDYSMAKKPLPDTPPHCAVFPHVIGTYVHGVIHHPEHATDGYLRCSYGVFFTLKRLKTPSILPIPV